MDRLLIIICVLVVNLDDHLRTVIRANIVLLHREGGTTFSRTSRIVAHHHRLMHLRTPFSFGFTF